MTNNKTIFFFCYRLMEFKLFLTSGIIKNCIKKNQIVLIIPKDAIDEVKKVIPQGIIIKEMRNKSSKLKNYKPNLFDKIESILRNILHFTYAKKFRYEKCISQKFQMKAYMRSQKTKGVINLFIGIFVICNSYLASYLWLYRIFIQKILSYFIDNNNHIDLYQKYDPSLVIVGSMGLDADGYVLTEAKKKNIKTLVINQSWDRVVCKGYPVCHPDYLFVWNYHMKDEAESYLDMPEKKIKILGSPIWDYIFNKSGIISKKDFFERMNLDMNKKTVYYPLNSAFWHDELMINLEEIFLAKKNKIINKDLQFIIRIHPYYWRNDKLRKELFDKLKLFDSIDEIFIDYNEIHKSKSSNFINSKDLDFTINCYNHCDLCLSVISSSMIEMIFAGKPALNFLYGKWILPGEELLVKDYKLHHLEKLYSYNVIKHVYNNKDLFSKLNNINNLKLKKEDQYRMIEGEASVNRGTASEVYANEIYKLSIS